MADKTITEKEVDEAQERWANAIVEIGRVYLEGGGLVACARERIDELYAYGEGDPVLFKPTKCESVQFRTTPEGALSYFIGDRFVRAGFSEDRGFAIAPYKAVHFTNAAIIRGKSRAIAMGNYFFIDLNNGSTKVEYTFGYRRDGEKLVIDLHHSSLPYSQPTTA